MTDGSGVSEFRGGWRALAAATLGTSMATTAIPFYTLGVFMTPLEQARGWSRGDISFAATLVGFALPLSLLLAGRLIDRFGVRLVAASGHLALGIGFVSLSFVGPDIRHFWMIHALIGLIGVGASPITFTRALIDLFDRRRGLAIGICLAGAGIGAAVASPLLGAAIQAFGWTSGYLLLGALSLGLVPLALCWLPAMARRSGEAGATPTGDARNAMDVRRPGLLMTLICILFFTVSLSVNGFIVHLVPLLVDAGAGMSRASWIAGLVGVAVIVGRLSTGALLDRIPVTLLGSAIFALAAIGIFALGVVNLDLAPLACFAIGLTIGAEVDLVAYLVSRCFGPAEYSWRFGGAYSAFMLGSGISPLVAGWMYDTHGTYDTFILSSTVAMIFVSAAFLALHRVIHGRKAAGGPGHA